ncbi:hypothetical protein GS472_01680 [Rhodococcus hoagii]|nr:hypothetical protein [Prescottella equi]
MVELRNNAGGTRTVPAFEPDLVERLGRLSDYAGDGLVLAPHKKTTQRNEVNRIAEALRRLGIRASTLSRSGTGGCWTWPNAYPQLWCCSWRMLLI